MRASSSGFVMKATSTRTAGAFTPMRTRKGACFTPRVVMPSRRLKSACTISASRADAERCWFCARSQRMRSRSRTAAYFSACSASRPAQRSRSRRGEPRRGPTRRGRGSTPRSVRGRRPEGGAVDREEDVHLRRVRGGGAVIEANRRVRTPRRHDAVAAALQDLLNGLRERERRVLLEKAAGTLRSFFDAAVPGSRTTVFAFGAGVGPGQDGRAAARRGAAPDIPLVTSTTRRGGAPSA